MDKKRGGVHLLSRYEWPLARKELIRLLTGYVFSPAGCPHTHLTRVAFGGGAGLFANNPSRDRL